MIEVARAGLQTGHAVLKLADQRLLDFMEEEARMATILETQEIMVADANLLGRFELVEAMAEIRAFAAARRPPQHAHAIRSCHMRAKGAVELRFGRPITMRDLEILADR